MYSFIPKSEEDILNSTLTTKNKVALLYKMIQTDTENEMLDPIAIDFTKPNIVKISRKLQYDIDIKKLAKETGLTLTIGNGSRGNQGGGNKGIAFEKYLSKDLGLYIMTRSYEEDYKYPTFMKRFIKKYLKDKKDIEIIDEGGLNKPRPLIFEQGKIYIGGTPNAGVSDIGSVVTDLTVKTDKGNMYLSLKMGPTVSLFNSGIAKILPKEEINSGLIRNKNGLELLEMLGLDQESFIEVFKSYKPSATKKRAVKKSVDVTNKVNKAKLKEFLASGLGYGYYLIHAEKANTDNISEYFISSSDVYNYVTPLKVITDYPISGSSKRIDVRISTPKFEFKVNIRNKSGGIHPTHIICDYKIKHWKESFKVLNFKSFITEQTRGKGLTVFDIDETLFQTKAMVKIMKDGKLVRSIDNQEYNTYKLKPGESYDYGEFRSAEVFQNTSIPIMKMIQKAKAIIANATKSGSKVIIVTARGNFDDKKKFLDTFRRYGIDIDNVYVERAGALNLGSSAKNKRFIFHKYLRGGKYERIRFFDDAMPNLTMFKALRKKYPNVSFEAYHVKHDGSVKKV